MRFMQNALNVYQTLLLQILRYIHVTPSLSLCDPKKTQLNYSLLLLYYSCSLPDNFINIPVFILVKTLNPIKVQCYICVVFLSAAPMNSCY